MSDLITTGYEFLRSASEIAKRYPTFEDRLEYKRILDAINAAVGRTPERIRADIETQAALASAIDKALERGDVRAERDGWVLSTMDNKIPNAEVDRWRKVRKVPFAERKRYYEAFPKCSRAGLLRWWNEMEVDAVESSHREAGGESSNSATAIYSDNLSDFVGGKFGTVYADPPWAYSNQGTRASTGNHYNTMSIAELCAMPIADMVSDDAHLHLWTTNSFLREAFDVIDAWGFEYKSCAVWCKPQIGIGNYVRVSHEFILIGVRGNAKSFKEKNIRSWFENDRTKHSAKPDYWRKVVEKNSPGPWLELFGRERVPGWNVFGNQISNQRRVV